MTTICSVGVQALLGMLPVQNDHTPEQEAAMRMSVAYASDSSQVGSASAKTGDFESARETSPSSSEDSATVTLQLRAPPFPVNSAAGLCGPILLGASAYGQVDLLKSTCCKLQYSTPTPELKSWYSCNKLGRAALGVSYMLRC